MSVANLNKALMLPNLVNLPFTPRPDSSRDESKGQRARMLTTGAELPTHRDKVLNLFH